MSHEPTAGVWPALTSAHVVVAAGAGGVGKTTVSAALGLALAREGRRVLVLTVDPARRLADALGHDLGPDPSPVHLPGEPLLHAAMRSIWSAARRIASSEAVAPATRASSCRSSSCAWRRCDSVKSTWLRSRSVAAVLSSRVWQLSTAPNQSADSNVEISF